MAIESVEPSIENMLEETRPLSTHDGIALNGLEVSIWQIAGEHFHQPFAFRVGGVASRFGTLSSDQASCPAGARLPLTLLGRS